VVDKSLREFSDGNVLLADALVTWFRIGKDICCCDHCVGVSIKCLYQCFQFPLSLALPVVDCRPASKNRTKPVGQNEFLSWQTRLLSRRELTGLTISTGTTACNKRRHDN
jgi:hypothetical protein